MLRCHELSNCAPRSQSLQYKCWEPRFRNSRLQLCGIAGTVTTTASASQRVGDRVHSVQIYSSVDEGLLKDSWGLDS